MNSQQAPSNLGVSQGNLEESGEISPWMWGGGGVGGAGGVGGSSDKLDDGGGLEVEYMDLDEFLLENELPITSLFDEQSNHATGGVPQPGDGGSSSGIGNSNDALQHQNVSFDGDESEGGGGGVGQDQQSRQRHPTHPPQNNQQQLRQRHFTLPPLITKPGAETLSDPTGPPQVPPPSTSASSLISPTAQQQQTEAAAQLLVTLSGLEPQQQHQQGTQGKTSVQVAASSSANIAQTGSLPSQPTTSTSGSSLMNNFLFGSAKVVDKGESSQLKEAAGGSQQLTLVSVSAVGPTATTNTSREKQNVARGGIEGGGGLSLDEDRLRARLAEEEKETALAAAAAEVAVQESNLLTVATASASTGPAGRGKRKGRTATGDDKKDEQYWERRRKNNIAAKRSRDSRRAKDNQTAMQATFLERENRVLMQELGKARADNHLLRERLSKYEKV